VYTPRSPVVYDVAVQRYIDECKTILEPCMREALKRQGVHGEQYGIHVGFVPVLETGRLVQLGVVAAWREQRHVFGDSESLIRRHRITNEVLHYCAVFVAVELLVSPRGIRWLVEALEQKVKEERDTIGLKSGMSEKRP
jgi:hypothetical protein